MLLDTGASSTWVMGGQCKSAPCQIHNTFGPADSSTYLVATGTFTNSYGTGNVSGTLVKDDMTVAGVKLPMTFGVADIVSDHFNYFPIDGILGLSLRFATQPTFLQTLVASRQLKNNLFAISLARASDGINDGEHDSLCV